MKCELCNSDEPEPRQRLCVPCIEAVARLCWIMDTIPERFVGSNVSTDAADNTERDRVIAVMPIAGFL